MIQMLLIALCLLTSPSTQPSDFPASWAGTWSGPSKVVSPGKPPMDFEMELGIAPTDDPKRWNWTIVYINKGDRQERPYELIEVDAAKGDYKVDEKQGIVIPSRFVDGALLCEFSVGEVRIHGSYRMAGDAIIVELTTIDPGNKEESGGKDGVPTVTSYRVLSQQRAVLKKK